MKIIDSLINGMILSFKSWKIILIIILVNLMIVCMVAMPMQASIESGFGNSTITEKLRENFSFEVFRDMGAAFDNLVAFFTKGLVMIMIAGFLINVFFSGGIFKSLRDHSAGSSVSEFFRSSSENFWAFFLILMIISILILLTSVFLVIIPLAIVCNAKVISEVIVFNTGVIGSSAFIFSLLILLLVADYARAWQVVHDKVNCLKAVGFGFRQTFKTFYSSYPMMLIIILIQVVYIWLVLHFLAGIKPVTGRGIILLFLLSQFLFFIRILLKLWRYGSVIKMLDICTHSVTEKQANVPF